MKIEIKVIPSASRLKVERTGEGLIKVYVTSAPEKGKANKQVIDALCKFLGKKKSRVRIVRGLTSRHKVVEIDG